MTATSYEGVAVVRDEPTEAAGLVNSVTGEPLTWTRTRTLTLADGRVVYGCGHDGCDYVRPKKLSIRPHMNAHRTVGRRIPSPHTSRVEGLAGLTISEIADRVASHDRIAADRDSWRARAKVAEKSLATLRGALGVPARPE